MRCFLLLIFSFCLFQAQGKGKSPIQLTQADAGGCIIEYRDGSWHPSSGSGNAIVVRLDESTGLMQKGCPDLPKLSFSLALPQGKKAVVSLSDLEYKDYSNIEVLPSKGQILRNINPSSLPFEYGDVYQTNAFFPSELYSMPTPYTFRSVQGQTIHIQPIQYNPVTKILRVYSSMKLIVRYVEDVASNYSHQKENSTSFDPLYEGHFLNYFSQKPLYAPMASFGSMLVVCPPAYLNAIQPFVTWKRQKGMQVYVAKTDTIPNGVTNSSIYELAKGYYETKGIAYMLLVGDDADIPVYQGNVNGMPILGPSDMAYGYITGNDHFPEIIVGRFSGESEADIQTQVQRTILYEKYPNVSTAWYQRQIGIASDQGDATSDDGQIDYEHMCDIVDSNKNQYNYLNHQGYFDGSQVGCNDGAGNPTAADIVNEFNTGIGLLNYCGHGSTEQMSTSGFSVQSVQDLTNINGSWPILFNTACYNGNFKGYTCLGEALLRARDNQGKPQGALAAVMSSILQYWNPPMQGQDEMNAVLRGARTNNKATAYGPIVVSGLMSTMEQYNTVTDPDDGNQTADTWIIFGDPSVEVKTKNEGSLVCSHSGWMQKNSWDFFVGCSTEGARVSLYYQGDVLATALVQNGVAHLIFNPIIALDSITVTATKQNWLPYFGRVDVVDFPTSNSQLHSGIITMYPVPAQDQLHVEWPLENGYAIFELMDITGKVLAHRSVDSTSSIELNTSNLSYGKYMIRLSGKQTLITSFMK